ncbi:MAG: hypothetical protein J5I94_25375 [Phaeodactylibacter sp.]|nr:hypothetical protein [Phaeodactylibacter sp.]
MKVIHRESGELLEAVIELAEDKDWKIIQNENTFQFDWNFEKGQIVHKIRLETEEEILGLVSIEDIPKEFRIHIRLIEVNVRDVGKQKRYDNIAGCLFAFICELAFQKDYEGYVSLQPKTELAGHYVSKYGFQQLGKNLFIELDDSRKLINKYLNDE